MITEPKWAPLTILHDRLEAGLLEQVLAANGIPSESLHEEIAHLTHPKGTHRAIKTQIFVPRHTLPTARLLLAAISGQKSRRH